MKQEHLKKFLEKTPAHEKKQRQIHGRMMDYVDARYVEDRFDEVAGPGHWQTKVKQADFAEDGYAFLTTIEIYIDELDAWVGKTDGGAQDSNTNKGGKKVSPENDFKGALSDSLKRAAVLWGIGRDLYQPEKHFEENINENRISSEALEIVVEQIKAMDFDDKQRDEFVAWLEKEKISLGKRNDKMQFSGWNIEPEQVEALYKKLSEIKEVF